jgi:hypothetical protein
MKKTCPVCHHEFTGRSDKRFCSVSCKNAYHNTVFKEESIIKVDQALHRNKLILQQLIPVAVTQATLDRAILEKLGFHFELITGIYVSPEGVMKRRVYDYCWSEAGESAIGIERIEDVTVPITGYGSADEI